MKLHPEYSEKWVQGLIANDPAILGLGELVLKDKERIQPRAGRLDLLLQELETGRRYELELQLGATDEAHIIRTIEYWDIERRRYPQYDHCAVLVAEDITSRFLNVISLLNGQVPLIALQMSALQVGGSVTLVFTKVVDEFQRGVVDEDEDAAAAPTDRAYWEHKRTKPIVAMSDDLFSLVTSFDPAFSLNYTKHYIGFAKDGEAMNFAVLRPRKKRLTLEVKLPQVVEIDCLIEAGGFDTLEYNKRWGAYRLQLTKPDLTEKADVLRRLLKAAYDERTG